MAASILAEVFTLTFYGLGEPKNLSLNQVKRAVHEAAAYYWTDLIQSDQNQIAKVSASIPFVANQVVYSLISITDFSTPIWVEIQVGSNVQTDWQLIPVINRDTLPEYRNRPELVCSIYSNINKNRLQPTIEFSYAYITATGGSNNNFRVWYDPSITINNSPELPTALPVEYNYMLANHARIALIPICIQADIQEARENKTESFIVDAKMQAWKAMQASEIMAAAKWAEKWNYYKNAGRSGQGGGKKRRISPYYL